MFVIAVATASLRHEPTAAPSDPMIAGLRPEYTAAPSDPMIAVLRPEYTAAPSDSKPAALFQQLNLLASLVTGRDAEDIAYSRSLATQMNALIDHLYRLVHTLTDREDRDSAGLELLTLEPRSCLPLAPTCVDPVLDAVVAACAPILSATRPFTSIAAQIADRRDIRTDARVVNRDSTCIAARVVN